MRTLIKLVLIVVVVLVGYNYFYGTSEEKSESQEIVDKVKDLGKSIGSLLKNEKNKFDEGKFDNLFENLGNVFKNIEDKIDGQDGKSKGVLEDLKQKKNDLEDKWNKRNRDSISNKDAEEFESEMKDLYQQMEDLLKDIDQ
ncbi:hypothetical protein [Membranihabitans marinus]|uniref:hypothetical protein n=1 Tax=Membranihabitans marinus TaxID=1227546 RepID=UPI001F3E0DBF|nr:hypothetical protein [Membranihabitans marinus]